MKPSTFGYSRPESLEDALRLLGSLGADGSVLAGGQSLVPLLSMRLAAPAHLVDINRVRELGYVRTDRAGVRVGALARHADLEHDQAAAAAQPLLRQATRLVAHPTIRNRGTTVGSITHADPSGELPAVLALLGGAVRLATAGGQRDVPAGEFFRGMLETAIASGELAVEAFFPALPARSGTAFVEVARRHGDYAVCGVAVLVGLDDDLRIASARAAYISVAPAPLLVELTEAVRGRGFDGDFSAAGDAASDVVEPPSDIHASAEYRRHLAGVLTVRAVREAARAAAA